MDATVQRVRELVPPRLAPLDALRGLIMIFMALDHANLFIAHGHSRPEMWAGGFPTYSDPLTFFTRAITHTAAPGFFFLMGAGMVLFDTSRAKLGWSRERVMMHLVIRGTSLILFQFFLENPAWIWGSGGPFTVLDVPIYFGVLYGLGGAMIFGALLVRASVRVLFGCSIALLVGTELVIRFFVPQILQFSPQVQLLLLPGGSEWFNVLYPILPWLGVTTFGMVFGKWFAENPENGYRRALYFGVAFLLVYLPLRAWNGFGNIRAQVGSGWIAFLNNVKYPPSITFLLLALGIDLTLLFTFSRNALSLVTRHASPLMVFGATPLFFYIAHLYLYGFIGRTFFPNGADIPAMYPYWLLGLVILYPLCWLYRKFKNSTPPDSLWRFF